MQLRDWVRECMCRRRGGQAGRGACGAAPLLGHVAPQASSDTLLKRPAADTSKSALQEEGAVDGGLSQLRVSGLSVWARRWRVCAPRVLARRGAGDGAGSGGSSPAPGCGTEDVRA